MQNQLWTATPQINLRPDLRLIPVTAFSTTLLVCLTGISNSHNQTEFSWSSPTSKHIPSSLVHSYNDNFKMCSQCLAITEDLGKKMERSVNTVPPFPLDEGWLWEAHAGASLQIPGWLMSHKYITHMTPVGLWDGTPTPASP